MYVCQVRQRYGRHSRTPSSTNTCNQTNMSEFWSVVYIAQPKMCIILQDIHFWDRTSLLWIDILALCTPLRAQDIPCWYVCPMQTSVFDARLFKISSLDIYEFDMFVYSQGWKIATDTGLRANCKIRLWFRSHCCSRGDCRRTKTWTYWFSCNSIAWSALFSKRCFKFTLVLCIALCSDISHRHIDTTEYDSLVSVSIFCLFDVDLYGILAPWYWFNQQHVII